VCFLFKVYAKVIITGNQQGQQGQPVMLATSQAGETFCSGQPIKIISGSGAGQSNVSLLGSPTKAITLAQAQQMGLLSPAKLQQILPSSPAKQVSFFFLIRIFIYYMNYSILNKLFLCILAEYYCKQTCVSSCEVTCKNNNDASFYCCKISY